MIIAIALSPILAVILNVFGITVPIKLFMIWCVVALALVYSIGNDVSEKDNVRAACMIVNFLAAIIAAIILYGVLQVGHTEYVNSMDIVMLSYSILISLIGDILSTIHK